MDQLVKQVLQGEKGAATRFYKALAPVVKRYLTIKLPGNEEVEEITQEVFLSALDSLSLYRGEASLKTWILSIARHEVADYYRKRYVHRMIEQTTPLFDSMLADINTPEFEMKKRKLRRQFMQAYKSLSEQHRDVLSYRFELGMSVKEIAVRMEMSQKATESMLYRARVAFRVAYEARLR